VGVSKFSGFSFSAFESPEKTTPLAHRVDVNRARNIKAGKTSQAHYSDDHEPVPEVFSRLGFEWLYRIIRH
jgi:hypothetical protein